MDLTYRQQVALTGALVGAAAGALLAIIYSNRSQGDEAGEKVSLKFSDISRVALAVGALVRQINSLAERTDE